MWSTADFGTEMEAGRLVLFTVWEPSFCEAYSLSLDVLPVYDDKTRGLVLPGVWKPQLCVQGVVQQRQVPACQAEATSRQCVGLRSERCRLDSSGVSRIRMSRIINNTMSTTIGNDRT